MKREFLPIVNTHKNPAKQKIVFTLIANRAVLARSRLLRGVNFAVNRPLSLSEIDMCTDTISKARVASARFPAQFPILLHRVL